MTRIHARSSGGSLLYLGRYEAHQSQGCDCDYQPFLKNEVFTE
jgi:hypothetical protein